MPSRRRSRERALQILFLWDSSKQPVEEAIDSYHGTLFAEEPADLDRFALELVRGSVEYLPEVDGRITRNAEHWRLERMPAVDRSILRLAVFEMTHCGTPAPVAIDEALELARKFSGEDSVQFVNGVLDAVRREFAAESPEAGSSQSPAPQT